MAAGPRQQVQVRLFRDSFSTPWGFRLQGGQDLNQPLCIQRVFVGSPAEGELHRGDIVYVLEDYNASQLTHKEAQDIVKKAGGQLGLWVIRGSQQRGQPQVQHQQQTVKTPPVTPTYTPSQPLQQPNLKPKPLKKFTGPLPGSMSTPKSPSAKFGCKIPVFQTGASPSIGTDFSKRSIGRQLSDDRQMMSLVSDTLSNVVLQQPPQTQPTYLTPSTSMDDVDNYELQSVRDRKQMFQHRPQGASQPRKSGKRVTINPNPKYELGWSPGQSAKAPAPQWAPANFNREMEEPVSEKTRNSPPLWTGSLRAGGDVKPWDVSNDTFGVALPSDNRKPAPYAPPKLKKPPQVAHKGVATSIPSDGSRVVHLQYNTPLQMYSKDNAEQMLTDQTTGQPGAGTLKITGEEQRPMDITDSPTYKFLHYNEKQAHQPHSSRYNESAGGEVPRYHGYIDQNRQSLAFKSIQKITDTDEGGVSEF